MGAESARETGGRVPQSRNQRGMSFQKLGCFITFFVTHNFCFAFSNIFKIKWPKSEEKLNFGVGGFGCLIAYESVPPPPIKTSWWRPYNSIIFIFSNWNICIRTTMLPVCVGNTYLRNTGKKMMGA